MHKYVINTLISYGFYTCVQYLKWMLRLGIEVNGYACEAQCVSVFVSALVYVIVLDPL